MRSFNESKNDGRPVRNFKNDKPRRNTGNNNNANNDKANRIQDLISKQEKNLDAIDTAVSFLDKFVTKEKTEKATIVDLLNEIKNAGHNQETVRAISQFNYMFVDLANAQCNSHISADRVNIRVKYIKERFITSYRRELYGRIDKLFEDHPLFKVDYSEED